MPTFGLNTDGRGDLVARAQRAERLGFDSFGVGEHVLFHYPTTNALISLAGIATATATIDLVAAVALLPLYPAALLAKMAVTLDHLSSGRFQLGVGVGGEYPAEFSACGVPLAERGARADEALELMRSLWSGAPTHFAGRFAHVEGELLAPPPTRGSGPFVWVAGRSEAAMRRAARYGDGWMPYFRSPEALSRDVAALRSMASASGRDPASVRVGAVVFACVHDDATAAEQMVSDRLAANYAGDYAAIVARQAAAGPGAHCVERVEQYLAAGVDTVFFAALADADYEEENDERLAREVMAVLR